MHKHPHPDFGVYLHIPFCEKNVSIVTSILLKNGAYGHIYLSNNKRN